MPVLTQVPVVFPIQIGTHQYAVDYSKLQRRFLPSQRSTVDQQATPGETALNSEGAWIRSQTDWSLGGQQEVFDDEATSVPQRFYRQKDVQAVRRGRIQLSNVLQQRSTTRGFANNTVPWQERLMCQTGDSIFWIETNNAFTVYNLFRGAIATGPYAAFTTANPIAASGNQMLCLATDGTDTTWLARGGSGVSRATTEAGAWTAVWSAVPTNLVAYCNGRLLGVAAPEIFELDSGGLKVPIWTHTNPSWVWQGAVAGAGAIYVWGAPIRSGNEGAVYIISDVISGGALAPPKIALPMPPGEKILHMEPLSGLFVARTNLGLRILYPSGDVLTSGPLVTARDDAATNYPFYPMAISAYADGVLAAWVSTTSTTDWIARLDLSNFVNEAPAMHQGEYTPQEGTFTDGKIGCLKVVNRDSFGGSGRMWVLGGSQAGTPTRRIWAASIFQAANGDGTDREKATSGYFYSGWITFGLTEAKQPLSVKLIHDAIPTGASIDVYFVKPDGTEVLLGSTTVATTATEIAVNTATITPLREFQLKFVFNRGTTNTNTPTLRSWSLRSYPIATRQEEILLPIMMQEVVVGRNRHEFSQIAYDEWTYLKALVLARTPVTLTEGSVTTSVVVDDVVLPQGQIERLSRGKPRGASYWWEGTWYVRCISAV